MVSPVRVRVSPLSFCSDLQVKSGDAIEPRFSTGALYTDHYSNALGKHHVQPVYGFPLHVRKHVRVKVEGRVYPGVPEHLLDHLGVFAPGEHKRREAVAQRVERDVRQTRPPEQLA